MSVTVEKLEKNMAKLTIEVPVEEVAAAEVRAYNKNKGKITVPGFRKGKAPRNIIEKLYGADVFMEEAVNDVLPGAYEAACKESGLEVVSRPVLDYIQIEHGKNLIVTATVAVKPEVKLGEYKGLEVERESTEVSEDEVLAEIKKEQEKNATLRDVEDRPVLDYIQVEHGKNLIVTALVAVKPEVKLGEYKGLEVERESTEVTEDEVLAEIKKEQEKNATLRDVDDRAVQDGDTVNLNYAGTVDGVAFDGGTAENQELVIGSHHFIPGFEEQMVGMNIGEEKDLNVTFPEEYSAKDLAGKAAVFHVKVNSISVKELPELNDEFASEVSEFETLDAYKEDVKAKLTARKEEAARSALENAVLAKAVENAEMEIPAPMIESQAEDMVNEFGERLQMQGMRLEQYLQYTGMTMPQIIDQYKDQAKKRIEGRLVLEAIVDAEKIEVTEEDVEEGYKKLAERYSMEADKVKEFFDEESLENYKKDLATQKALDLLVAEAK